MSQANKDIIRNLRENAPRNPSVLDGLFTDDYVYHGIPMFGDLKGPTVFKKLNQSFVSTATGVASTSGRLGYGCLIVLGRPKPTVDSQKRSRNNAPHDLPCQVGDGPGGASSDYEQCAQFAEVELGREPDQDHEHPD